MILVFNILSTEQAAWLVIKKDQLVFQKDFIIQRGEDKSLLYLQEMLDNNKLKLKDFKALVLLVKDASMTQVKIFTTTVNTLAWQFEWPIVAEYYFELDNEKMLIKALHKLSKIKKFKALSPKYSRQADITLSKKQPKYKIAK